MDRAAPSPPQLDAPDVDRLWRRLRRAPRDVAARNQLAEHYYPLVRRVAAQLARRAPVEADELASAGALGLLQALAGFDPRRGVRFETYAQRRIAGAMLDELRAQDAAPRKARQRDTAVQQAEHALAHELGRRPTDDEVAGVVRLPAQPPVPRFRSLDRVHDDPRSDDRPARIEEHCADRRQADPSDRAQRRESLAQLLKGCSKVERLLVILYYFEGASMHEVGRHLGLSEARISQLHKQLCQRLRADRQKVVSG